ncbi:MAG: adenylate/guanylate cyclase domain-containing protein [Cucumibacter sp.]
MRGRRQLIAALLGLLILAALAGARLWNPYPLQAARDIGFDFYQRLAPRPAGTFPVRVVDIDEPSLAEIGQWPWPRDVLARLTDRLTELGAAAIAFDIVFSEADRASPLRLAESLGPGAALTADQIAGLPDFDEGFAEALAAAPSVLAFLVSSGTGSLPQALKSGVAIVGPDPSRKAYRMRGAVLPLPRLFESARGLGAINLNPVDAVDVIRRVPLVWTDGTTLFPALALEALRVAQGAGTLVVFGDDQGRMSSVRVGDFEAPTTGEGLFQVYYSAANPELYVSARRLLGEDDADVAPLIAGHIVLVGTSAEGLLDIKATPLGEDVPGVAIHAQIIEQMLSGQYLERSDWVVGLEILGFVLIGLAIIGAILRSGPRLSLAIGAGFVIAWLSFSWMAFRNYGLLIDSTFPLGGGFVVYAAMIFFQFTIADADKRQIRRAFGHYVAPAVLSEIERTEKLELGGEEKDLTIMFIDVRNYTTISEAMTPQALVGMLNRMFEALGAEITTSRGTIDKFIGDAIMAFWNAPLDVERHPLKACEAALKARVALARINAVDGFGLKASGNKVGELRIGIGIATGRALVGNMGLETRFDYSCVGDVVNVASRVESTCKALGFDIAVTDETRKAASELAFLGAGSLGLKGKSEREPVHILVGDAAMARSTGFKALAEAHALLVASLAKGEMDAAGLEDCRALAGPVEPRLADFYPLIPGRAGDFAVSDAEAMARARA